MSSDLLRCWMLLLIVTLAASSARAIIVAPPSAAASTAPVDDPGWLNVGDNGVYLGNGWVLTAFHVGAGTINFAGVGSFAHDPASVVRLGNAPDSGLTAQTDLLMFRLLSDPGLPALSLATSTAAVNSQVMLIGDGAATLPDATERHWDVTGTEPDLVWTEVPTGGDKHGYYSSVAAKRWGTNLIEDDEAFFGEGDANHTVPANAGFGDVVSLFTEFDKTGLTLGDATATEAQALSGDSGSAVFVKESGVWKLAGITHAVSLFDNQPFGSSTAVFGNLTFFADLSTYREQILAIASVPEGTSLLFVGAALALALAGYRWKSSRVR